MKIIIDLTQPFGFKIVKKIDRNFNDRLYVEILPSLEDDDYVMICFGPLYSGGHGITLPFDELPKNLKVGDCFNFPDRYASLDFIENKNNTFKIIAIFGSIKMESKEAPHHYRVHII